MNQLLWLSTILDQYACKRVLFIFSFEIVADWSTQVIKKGREPKR